MGYSIFHITGNAEQVGERSAVMNNKFRVAITVWDFTNREWSIQAEYDVDTESAFDALKATVGQITGEDELRALQGCQDYPDSSINALSQATAHRATQPSAYSN